MKKRVVLCGWVIFVLCIGGCTSPQTDNIPLTENTPTDMIPEPTSTPELIRNTESIPLGSPATINGSIEAGEWVDAATFKLSDGGLLYLKYAEGALYLALDGDVLGTINVGILKDGDLWVLHSSAALGSLVFKPFETGWELDKNWTWCCRAASMGRETENLLAAEGWLSHNQFVGNQLQTEFQIQIPREEIVVTVTYLFRDGSGAAYWPVDLSEEDLLHFTAPPEVGDQAIFSDEAWVNLIVVD